MKRHTPIILSLIWAMVLIGLPTSVNAQMKKLNRDTLKARTLLKEAYSLMDSLIKSVLMSPFVCMKSYHLLQEYRFFQHYKI